MSHVLVIDDSENVRTSVKRMLESAGFQVSLADDGEEGVSLFREERFDLVISDVVMPRKDGLQTVREIREMSPDIPIVLMSKDSYFGSEGPDAANSFLPEAKEVGATRAIAKPFSRDNLLKVVGESVIDSSKRLFAEVG